MKAVILAGGYGTRLSEETDVRPKPMVHVAERPILWHIMKFYSAYGINDFVVCCGYKSYVIKEYFANYFLHMSDVTIDLKSNKTKVHEKHAEPWTVTLVDTGEETLTGGRLKRVIEYLEKDEPFMFTYGDGLCDVDLDALLRHHKKEKRLATVTAVQPLARYGALNLDKNAVLGFMEKPKGGDGWINGGFFVVEPKVLSLIKGDDTSWEAHTLPVLAGKQQLSAYCHTGFWRAMDTLRDKHVLEEMWNMRKAPWKRW